MAKKPRTAGTTDVAALKASLPADVKVIEIPAGANVTVDVDVNEMVIPYTIALDTHVLIKSLVDRREDIPSMTAGVHRLSWGFAHAVKGWKHDVAAIIGGKRTPLESRSEANKDGDHSIGVAFLIVPGATE